jgi:hypothetical protein
MDSTSRRVLVLSPVRANALRILQALPGTQVIEGPSVPRGPRAAERLYTASAEAVERHGCTHVVATAERNMAVAGRLRDAYALPGLNWIQSLAVTDKRAMRLWAEPLVPMAAAWPGNEVLANPALLDGRTEVVIKPVSGAACHGVVRLPAAQAVSHVAAASGPQQVEAALDVDVELHCDGYFTDRAAPVMVVSAYDRPLLTSIGTTQGSFHLPVGHPWSRSAAEIMAALVKGIPVTAAAFHAELLVAGGRVYLGEIALRPASGGIAESLLRHHGLDVWDAFVRLQAGLPPSPAPDPARRPDAAWTGVIGVVSDRPEDESRRAAELREVPGVEEVEHVGVRRSSLPGTSSAFMWHVFFRAATEERARALVRAVAAVAQRIEAGRAETLPDVS